MTAADLRRRAEAFLREKETWVDRPVCTGDRPVDPTRTDPLDLDWPPAPGLFSLAKRDIGEVGLGLMVLAWLDRVERRALELELDLAGCRDSGLT